MIIINTLSEHSRGLSASLPLSDAAGVHCQICGSSVLPGVNLGHHPVGDLILSSAQLNEPETFYPMQLFHCPECGLCQLGYTVDPAVVYKNFPFVSGTTHTATPHLQSLAQDLVARLKLDGSSLAIDIGSNDGTLLKGYRPYGVKHLGVDPSELPVQIANDHGIPTLHAFFNEDTADSIAAEFGRADAISACGCFAHIADLAGVMKGVKSLLKSGGIFATDNQYWLDMVQRKHYDNIFHEHLRNYSLKPLQYLFRQYDMEIIDVERSEVYGGSIRVFSAHRGDHPISERVQELRALEEAERLYEQSTNEQFAHDTANRRRALSDAVYHRVSKGQKVVGIGAPAKASTVCNYCRLGSDLIEYVTEVNPLRMNKYLPGVHIPIVDEEFLFQDPKPPDAGILFAWNYYDEIVPKLRARGFHGEILCP